MPYRRRYRGGKKKGKKVFKRSDIGSMLSSVADGYKDIIMGNPLAQPVELASSLKHGLSGNGTFTKTKKQRGLQAKADGTGGTYSNFTLVGKYQKKVPLGQNITNVTVGSAYMANATGDVFWRTNNYNWNATDHATMLALANDVDANTGRMFIKGIYTKTVYESLDPGNIDLMIYDIVAKSETPTAFTDPVVAIQTGIDTEGGSSTSYLVPGFRPENSALFRSNFKVIKETRVSLGPGKRHVHHFRHVINKWLDKQDVRSGDTVHFPYITTFQMAMIRGPVVMDSTNNAQITYGRGKVAVISEKRYNAIMASDLRRITAATNNTVDPTTAAQHINPVTGAVITDVVSAEAGAA